MLTKVQTPYATSVREKNVKFHLIPKLYYIYLTLFYFTFLIFSLGDGIVACLATPNPFHCVYRFNILFSE